MGHPLELDGDYLNCTCSSLSVDAFGDLSRTLTGNNLSFYHLNIRGCRTNFDEFVCLLNTFHIKFSVIALTETNLSHEYKTGFSLPGYKSLDFYSKHGIKIFYLSSLSCSLMPNFTFNNEFLESYFISVKGANFYDILLGIIFNEYFDLNVLSKLPKSKKIVLMGDFNINLFSIESNSAVHDFYDIMTSKNLIPGITKLTRPNMNNNENHSLIDHIWTNILVDTNFFVIETTISDHYSILLYLNAEITDSLVKVTFRDFSAENVNKFVEALPNLRESYDGNLECPTLAVNDFLSWFDSTLNHYFPIKSKSIGKKRYATPWITDIVMKCIKKKHRFHTLVRQGILKQEFYNKYRNLVTYAIRRSKQIYYNNAFSSAKSNIKKTWKLLNNLKKTDDVCVSLPELKDPDHDNILCNGGRAATVLNDFFINSVSELRANLPDLSDNNRRCFNDIPFNNKSFFIRPTNDIEVTLLLNSMPNKGYNLWDIPIFILKLSAPFFATILEELFNLIIFHGIYPDSLKCAHITPILKRGDTTEPCNYRPISVLISIDKLFEKLIVSRLSNFLTESHIMHEHQFGFTAGKGTADACMSLVGSILHARSLSHYALAIFVDFRKAFDTIDHNRLLFKLEQYGVRGTPLSLFKSYLSGRSQMVVFGDHCSGLSQIDFGVPQGSVLGPILFNIYINDLNYFLDKSLNFFYADDTSLIISDKNIEVVSTAAQQSLNTLINWCSANFVTINSEKTKYMIFGNGIIDNNLYICDTSLEQVSTFKYLGLTIDSNLSFDSHINSVRSKLSQIAGASHRLGGLLPVDVAWTFYFSSAYPILTYMIVFWGGNWRD